MATNEPMTDARLAEISARVKNAWAIQAVGPANMGDLEPWQLQSIAVAYVDDVADLLSEHDRLRAREQALAAENAAMRPVVEAVAAGDMTYSDPEFGDVNCIFNCAPGSRFGFHHAANCQARAAQAFVAAHPATAAAGESESEEED